MAAHAARSGRGRRPLAPRGALALSAQRSIAARVPTLHCGARVLRLERLRRAPAKSGLVASVAGITCLPCVTVCLLLIYESWLNSLATVFFAASSSRAVPVAVYSFLLLPPRVD